MSKQQRLRFKRSDIPGLALVIVFLTFWLYMWFERPDWQPPSGFGPEWQCTAGGARGGGPSFCIKKPAVDPDGRKEWSGD
jgi:hypothetical protein